MGRLVILMGLNLLETQPLQAQNEMTLDEALKKFMDARSYVLTNYIKYVKPEINKAIAVN